MTIIPELREAVIDGQAKLAVTKVTQGLEQGIPAETLLQDGLIAAMKEVGQLFEEHEIYVPEMLVAARAMNAAVARAQTPAGRARGQVEPGRWPSARSRATCTTSARTWWR